MYLYFMIDANKMPDNHDPDQVTLSREEYDELLLFKQEYNRILSDNLKFKTTIEQLKHELDKLKRLFHGSKSERFIPERQPKESSAERPAPAKDKEPAKGHPRLKLPLNLPREEVRLEPEVDLTGATLIGKVETEILDYIPGRIIVKKYIRGKYLMPDGSIVIADLPSLPIPRGNVGPGLLSHLIVSKYVDHLPFYRQRQMFKRMGVELAESTVNDWFHSGCHLIEPLYDKLKQQVLSGNYLMADETPIPVLTDDKPGSTHKGYYWVYYDPIQRHVFFDYQKGRGREGPTEMLKEYKGALQADGYSGYLAFDENPGITLLGCMAHARRKFDEAKNNDENRALHALALIQKLYDTERKARESHLDFAQRKELRLREAMPIMDKFYLWLSENKPPQTLPKSAIGTAIEYTLNMWPRLLRYLDDGKFEIDNNLIENSIRPVALGRKNYLFAGSHDAAQRAAMIYSFFGTCKINNIEPSEWMAKMFTQIPDHSIQRLEELLPHNLR
jgi:transposase